MLKRALKLEAKRYKFLFTEPLAPKRYSTGSSSYLPKGQPSTTLQSQAFSPAKGLKSTVLSPQTYYAFNNFNKVTNQLFPDLL